MKFRKRSIVIEAEKYDGSVQSAASIIAWANELGRTVAQRYVGESKVFHLVIISGRNPELIACPGDYIFKGHEGELYPVCSDVFEANYEPVQESIEPAPVKPSMRDRAMSKFKSLCAHQWATKNDLNQLKQEIKTMVDTVLSEIQTTFDNYKADVNTKLGQLQAVIASSSMSADDQAAAQAILSDIQGADAALNPPADAPPASDAPAPADPPASDAPVEAPAS